MFATTHLFLTLETEMDVCSSESLVQIAGTKKANGMQ